MLGARPFATHCPIAAGRQEVLDRLLLPKAAVAMTILQKKARLKKRIEAESDPAVLDQVNRVLDKAAREKNVGGSIVERALRAEEDHTAGRYQTLEAFDKEIGAFIDSLYPAKPKTGRRA